MAPHNYNLPPPFYNQPLTLLPLFFLQSDFYYYVRDRTASGMKKDHWAALESIATDCKEKFPRGGVDLQGIIKRLKLYCVLFQSCHQQ